MQLDIVSTELGQSACRVVSETALCTNFSKSTCQSQERRKGKLGFRACQTPQGASAPAMHQRDEFFNRPPAVQQADDER